MALECQEALTDIWTRNKASIDKLAVAKKEIKRIKTEVEAMRAQGAEDMAKLEFALV